MQETEQFINTGLKLSSSVIPVMAFTHFQKHCPSWVLLCFQWILIRMLQLHPLHELYWFRTAQLLAAVFQVLSIRFWEDAHNLVLSQKLLNKDTMKSHHWVYSSLQLVSFHSGNFYLHYLLVHCYFKKINFTYGFLVTSEHSLLNILTAFEAWLLFILNSLLLILVLVQGVLLTWGTAGFNLHQQLRHVVHILTQHWQETSISELQEHMADQASVLSTFLLLCLAVSANPAVRFGMQTLAHLQLEQKH